MLAWGVAAMVSAAAIVSSEPAILAEEDIRFGRSGHIIIDVEVNGRGPYAFVVDTGAQTSVVFAYSVAMLPDEPMDGLPSGGGASDAEVLAATLQPSARGVACAPPPHSLGLRRAQVPSVAGDADRQLRAGGRLHLAGHRKHAMGVRDTGKDARGGGMEAAGGAGGGDRGRLQRRAL